MATKTAEELIHGVQGARDRAEMWAKAKAQFEALGGVLDCVCAKGEPHTPRCKAISKAIALARGES